MILCEKMHSHSINKFNGVTLWHDFEVTTAKVGTIQQNYNVIGEVNLRVKVKRIYTQGDPHHVRNSGVYSANIIFQMMPFLLLY